MRIGPEAIMGYPRAKIPLVYFHGQTMDNAMFLVEVPCQTYGRKLPLIPGPYKSSDATVPPRLGRAVCERGKPHGNSVDAAMGMSSMAKS